MPRGSASIRLADDLSNTSGEEDEVLLESLNFSDLYIRLDEAYPSRYRIGPNVQGVSGNARVPAKFDRQIDLLRAQISKSDRNEGTISFDSMRLRFSRAHLTANGEQSWAAIRRIPLELPYLDDLGLRPEAATAIASWGRKRGIVVIGGATGAGKTTTGVAALREYLTTIGGIAIAIEDPPEYLLQGEIGDGGYCFQMEVADDTQWGDAIKTALRWRPRYIFLGEVRTPEAARQALRASTSGHLVMTTVHGGSVDESLGTVLRLAEADMGEVARSLLVDNLVAVVHQRMSAFGPDVSILRNDRATYEPIRQAVRSGQLAPLNDLAVEYRVERRK